jgi:hypothetical protein
LLEYHAAQTAGLRQLARDEMRRINLAGVRVRRDRCLALLA